MDDEEIAEYYNFYAGATPEEALKEATSFDQFKNPAGETFDLGRNDKFKGFEVLIGGFYRRPGDFNNDLFMYSTSY